MDLFSFGSGEFAGFDGFGPGAGAVVEGYGGAEEAELFAEPISNVAGELFGGELGVVDEEFDVDGGYAGLGGVVNFEAFAVLGGEDGGFEGVLYRAVEQAGGELGLALGCDLVDDVDAFADVEAGLGGGENKGAVVEEGDDGAEEGFGFGLGDAFFFHKVPFVEDEDAGFVFALDERGDVFVLGGGADFGIHEDDGDVAGFDAFFSTEEAEAFDGGVDLMDVAHAGGVDEGVVTGLGAGADGEGDFDTVAGGAGDVGDDDAVAVEEAVDVGGFAGVGAADDGDAQGLGLGRVDVGGEVGEDGLHEVVHAVVVQRGDGEAVVAEVEEVAHAVFVLGEVALVDGDVAGDAGFVDEAGDFFIGGVESVEDIDDEDDDGGIGNGEVDLFADGGFDDVMLDGVVEDVDAAGVDEGEGGVVPHDFAHEAVACNAALVVYDGDAFACDAVEEGGFADVGTADDGHDACRGILGLCHGGSLLRLALNRNKKGYSRE